MSAYSSSWEFAAGAVQMKVHQVQFEPCILPSSPVSQPFSLSSYTLYLTYIVQGHLN